MQELLARADDVFTLPLNTKLGGVPEMSKLKVALWGRGPAVYLVHGWGGRASQWAWFIEPLVAAGFSVVAFDAPGHGDSPAPRTSIPHFAAALSAVVENVGPALGLIGHSLGASACCFALQRGVAAEAAVFWARWPIPRSSSCGTSIGSDFPKRSTRR